MPCAWPCSPESFAGRNFKFRGHRLTPTFSTGKLFTEVKTGAQFRRKVAVVLDPSGRFSGLRIGGQLFNDDVANVYLSYQTDAQFHG